MSPNVVYANLAKSQEEHLKFCNNIGSSVSTAKNEDDLLWDGLGRHQEMHLRSIFPPGNGH